MNEYMKDSIATHAWHEFVYCKNGDARREFLADMVERHPISFDNTGSSCVYVDDFMLPAVETKHEVDNYKVLAMAREYFSFSLVSALVEQTMRQIELDSLNERMVKFINNVNRLLVTGSDREVHSIEEFRAILLKAKEFYSEHYVKMMESGQFLGDVTSLPIAFLDLNTFVTYYKRALGMSKNFSILLDYSGSGALVSQKAVNGLITKRIAGDLSIKVVTEPQSWKTYTDLNGVLAEDVHDYSIVDLDGIFKQYMKTLIRF